MRSQKLLTLYHAKTFLIIKSIHNITHKMCAVGFDSYWCAAIQIQILSSNIFISLHLIFNWPFASLAFQAVLLLSDVVQMLTPLSLSEIVCLSKLKIFFSPTHI